MSISDPQPADFEQAEALMRIVARGLGEVFPGMGFTLLLFQFNAPGVSNYISNANREDMIKALRETADRLERREEIPPVKGHA
jgi:hypothetical protein